MFDLRQGGGIAFGTMVFGLLAFAAGIKDVILATETAAPGKENPP